MSINIVISKTYTIYWWTRAEVMFISSADNPSPDIGKANPYTACVMSMT
jgi:hypothetical protein